MPYVWETCMAGRTVEEEKHYAPNYGKHWVRGKPVFVTPESVKKAYQRRSLKKLRRLMNANFQDGEDCLLTLTFREDARPKDSDGLLDIMQFFCRKLRTEYKKSGYVLKYIYVMQVGKRGAMHAHMIVSWNNVSIFWKCWLWGYVQVKPLSTDGQYAKVAEYFLKYTWETEETEGKRLGKQWYPSKNLKQPVIKKKVIHAGRWSNRIRERKGYYLDKNSVREGISEVTGTPYFCYTLIKLRC